MFLTYCMILVKFLTCFTSVFLSRSDKVKTLNVNMYKSTYGLYKIYILVAYLFIISYFKIHLPKHHGFVMPFVMSLGLNLRNERKFFLFGRQNNCPQKVILKQMDIIFGLLISHLPFINTDNHEPVLLQTLSFR